MQLQKFKLLKDDTLEVTFKERKEDGTYKTVTEEHKTKAHPDLRQSLDNLRIHYGLLTGFVRAKEVKKIESTNDELTENIHVSGCSIKTGDNEGVVLTGYYINPLTGKAVIANSPFQNYGVDGEESAYRHIEDLISKVERANDEIAAYLSGAKKADEVQQSLPFDNPATPPQNRLPEDIDSEDVTGTEIQQRLQDAEIWKDGERPKV